MGFSRGAPGVGRAQAGISGAILMRSILRSTLAALTFTSTVWLAATPAAAGDYETCAKASGDQAIAACTRAIDSGRYSGRQLVVLFTNRCVELNDTQSDKAIADCSQAIRLDPNGAAAFSGRAGAYRAKGQYDRAIEDMNQAIRLSPNDADMFNNRGLAHHENGQYDRAIEDLNQAIRLNPNLAAAFYNRGNTHQHEDQHERAIEDFSQAIRLNPNYADALLNRGAAYYAADQYDRAIEDFNQTIRLAPNEAIAFYNRGMSWERKNDLQRALADFRTFSELAPSDPDGPKAIERVTRALSGRHGFRYAVNR